MAYICTHMCKWCVHRHVYLQSPEEDIPWDKASCWTWNTTPLVRLISSMPQQPSPLQLLPLALGFQTQEGTESLAFPYECWLCKLRFSYLCSKGSFLSSSCFCICPLSHPQAVFLVNRLVFLTNMFTCRCIFISLFLLCFSKGTQITKLEWEAEAPYWTESWLFFSFCFSLCYTLVCWLKVGLPSCWLLDTMDNWYYAVFATACGREDSCLSFCGSSFPLHSDITILGQQTHFSYSLWHYKMLLVFLF